MNKKNVQAESNEMSYRQRREEMMMMPWLYDTRLSCSMCVLAYAHNKDKEERKISTNLKALNMEMMERRLRCFGIWCHLLLLCVDPSFSCPSLVCDRFEFCFVLLVVLVIRCICDHRL